MSSPVSITVWGVRGSYPAPGPQTARVGGNTSSVQVRAGGHLIILDAGTGVICLGRAMVEQHRADQKPMIATLLFTHTHHDHTQGFPFFVPTHYRSTTLYVFGPKTLHQDLEEVLSRAMLPPVFPITIDELPCVRVMRNLQEGQVITLNAEDAEPHVLTERETAPRNAPEAVIIRVLHSHAHPQGVFVYRVEHGGKSLVFATDTEGYVGGDQRLLQFARGADLLIHDAQYTEAEYTSEATPKQGWGHSTWQMAVGVARAAGVRRLALTHHDPVHDDAMLEKLEREAQAAFPQTVLAREGLQIDL
ncbi:MAG: MBL fold metallo-hydrolase [Chloroflexota bacterium]|nr:MBL fold metallo-hydrolase [Chloroflexota bacterium]